MKKCNACGETRIEEFYTYLKTKCKSCTRANQLAFNRANPDYLKAKNQRRRAMKLSLPNKLTAKDWKVIVVHFDGRCALTDSTNIVLEHVIPLSWGHLGTTVHNVIPMDETLNLSKSSKNLLEWFNEIDASLEMHRKFDEMVEYLAELNGLTSNEYLGFVYWCEENKRTIDEVKADPRPSVDIWEHLRN